MTLFENNNSWNTNVLFDHLDWNDVFFNKDLGLLFSDSIELAPEDQTLRSIHWDCKRIESSSGSMLASEATSELMIDDDDFSKYEIRNHDCMWSGLCINNTTNKKPNPQSYNYNDERKHQTKKVTNNIDSGPSLTKKSPQGNIVAQEDIEAIKQTTLQNVQSVPPGTSLLLTSRILHRKKQQQQQQQMINFTIPNVTTIDFLREREAMPIARPDTPLSLDDDPPEFKHTVDLAACVMGSNNICLDTDTDKIIINKLKEQLEDTTKNIDIRQILPGNKNRSLSEVLNVIESENSVESTTMIATKVEPDDDEEEEEDSEIDDIDDVLPKNKTNGVISTLSVSNEVNDSIAHDDHCYTRSNGAIDVVGMGLETPSDSDEEIDVVSIGDKKLPNNPSDRDRRVLQTKVANKISARIVKTVNGVRTIPPRRRCSYGPYTTTVTPIKSPSYSNSRYTTSISTPITYQHSNNYYRSLPQTPSVNNNDNNSKYSSTNSRKRSAPISNSKDDQQHILSNKRHRSKKHKVSSRKHNYIMDEAETIEKRNLHNDMERQRRIGLKNLFEALKKHIPNIKDKERAPKVNILREAAKYCESLSKEEKVLMAQKYQLQLQQQRRLAQIQILQMSTMQIKQNIEK